MKTHIEQAINDQMREEFASAYIYLAMASYMEEENFKGFAQWLYVQWEEELIHAMKLRDFLLQRGGTVRLQALPQPKSDWGTPLAVFQEVLAHEQHITKRIHELYALAVEEKDYPLQTLMHWFIDEQVEEEDNASDILNQLHLIGDSGPNLFLLDRELGQRELEETE